MTEMNDAQLRQAFFDLFAIKSNESAVRKWGQGRIQYLEEQAKAMLRASSENAERIASLQSHLEERNATIDELEREIKIYQTAVSKITGSTSQESDEERHQRRRRERMLDEVTLICVRDGTEQMNSESPAEKTWGRMSRNIAENICNEINEYDAEQ